jgi:hypothetical protein
MLRGPPRSSTCSLTTTPTPSTGPSGPGPAQPQTRSGPPMPTLLLPGRPVDGVAIVGGRGPLGPPKPPCHGSCSVLDLGLSAHSRRSVSDRRTRMPFVRRPNGLIGIGRRLAGLKLRCQARHSGSTGFAARWRRARWPSRESCRFDRSAGSPRCRAGLVARSGGADPAPVRLRTWLQAAVSALSYGAAQGVWVPVPGWSRTMSTACRWVSREPAENA